MASYASLITNATSSNGSTGSAARTGSITTTSTSNAAKPQAARTGNETSGTTANAGKPVLARDGDPGAATTADAAKPVLSRGAPTPFTPVPTNAVLVPGDFRSVDVLVTDPSGEPLGEVVYITALSPFPATGKIDDEGRGSLPVLSASYTDFRAIAEREGSEGVQYAWFEGQDNIVTPETDEATIVVDPVEIKGLWAGSGNDFGGMLG